MSNIQIPQTINNTNNIINRVGYLFKKAKKTLGKFSKKFFYIDNNGILYYTKEEQKINKFLEILEKKEKEKKDLTDYSDEFYMNIIKDNSNRIKSFNLYDCSVSNKKIIYEEKFEKLNLKNRTYFDLFLKDNTYNTIMIIGVKEEYTNSLREFFLNIPSYNDMNSLTYQFRKYSEKNLANLSDFDADKIDENLTVNKFSGIINENSHLNNSNNLYNKNKSINSDNNNKNTFNNPDIINNKNFSFKDMNKFLFNNNNNINNNISNVIAEEFSPEKDSRFMGNKTYNMIHNNNIEFKMGIDNLNNKFNFNSNFNEDMKSPEEFNSFSTNNNISNFYQTENLQNKILFKKEEEKNHMENILLKLNGKFVNQIDWEKQNLKILKPSSNDLDYDETWSELENGSNYSGQVKNFMPNGIGKEYRRDGILYTGDFKNGKWNGVGTITDKNLDTYTGEFVNGCICGI